MKQRAQPDEPCQWVSSARIKPERLMIFTRYPQAGIVKTRLVPTLGSRRAARLQIEMTRHVMAWASTLRDSASLSVEVHFTGGSEKLMRRCFGSQLPYRHQGEGDLGRRMREAFRDAFRSGVDRAIIIGTDCPAISPEIIDIAMRKLRQDDLVLGPATDGGYYLIGLRRDFPRMFENIPWGSGEVLEATLARAKHLDLSVSMLETLRDVDRPADLHVWGRVGASHGSLADAKISVIIPTFNEDRRLGAALRSTLSGSNIETIVADTMGTKPTREIAQRCGARLVVAARGRACQMNAGAALASGQILLFLHADTLLPPDFDVHVRNTLSRPGVVAGAFELCIGGATGSLQLIEEAANLRSRLLQMPYGDQAIFLGTERFNRLGRFSQLPILEDVDLVRRLRRIGRLAVVPAAATTSARRWRSLGTWRTTIINQLVMAGYFLGIPYRRLAQLHDRVGRGYE
jgi:rSAM/selenodomain-associated transferase 2/rSAM/selenodomain-associated transferase 1